MPNSNYPITSDLDGIGWRVRGDFKAPEARFRGPYFPNVKEFFMFFPTIIRMLISTFKAWILKEPMFIDNIRPLTHNGYTGVPIGGIGSGSIGTDFRGGFNKFSLVPGKKETTIGNVKGDQFIITMKRKDGTTAFQSLLSVASFKSGDLSCWVSKFKKENVRYRGLYPRAWREFHIPHLAITVIMEQMSPILPHNYEESSTPVGTFTFTIINASEIEYDITLTLTFENGTGNKRWRREGECKSYNLEADQYSGMACQHTIRNMETIYAIACSKNKDSIITTSTFNPRGVGNEIWHQLYNEGTFEKGTSNIHSKELGIAVASQSHLGCNGQINLMFSLVWHMPEVEFGGKRKFRRRYAQFWGDIKSLLDMTHSSWKRWRKEIEQWQAPIISNNELPDWYRSALFNESYFLTDGCTVWFDYDEKWGNDEPSMSEHTKKWLKKYGRFAYIESWEYYMFNTYDVHFYASWCLLKNWPGLEMSIQLDYVDQVNRHDNAKQTSWGEGKSMLRKVRGAVPHDIGHPSVEPWLQLNAYILHDSSLWKDLNLKFIPICWRDWKRVYKQESMGEEAKETLENMYKISSNIIKKALSEWDRNSDGMIENSGMPDQTYDMWTMTGASAYCGSLWLSSLASILEMANDLEKAEDLKYYEELLKKASHVYYQKLWNGRFFSFDENPKNRNTVMADQMCGLWWQILCQEKLTIGTELIETALNTIYDLNLMSFKNGSLGPVNGILTSGKLDTSTMQSREVWTGTAYALSSFYILMGFKQKAFDVAKGMYDSCWFRFGLQYQTPEAIYEKGMYRAIGYMRPLSIWTIQEALEISERAGSH